MPIGKGSDNSDSLGIRSTGWSAEYGIGNTVNGVISGVRSKVISQFPKFSEQVTKAEYELRSTEYVDCSYKLGPSFGLDLMGGPCPERPRLGRSFHNDSVAWRARVSEYSSIQSAQSVCVIEQSSRKRAVDPLAGSLCRLALLARCGAGITVALEPIRDP